MTATRASASGRGGAAAAAEVVAAGTVCWRPSRGGGVEVLLVHRPRYDDWSLPKGKARGQEPLPSCAVRETAEETGLRVTLGRPLPGVGYVLPDGRTKEVSYWAAQAPAAPQAPGPPRRGTEEEVDSFLWVPADQAAARLTRGTDAAPLDAVLRMAREGTLATHPVLVLRHTRARPRDSWSRADGERPLVAAGRRQADGLAGLLDAWRPERVVSSPWRRCLDTVAPYLARSGARLSTKAGLTEHGFGRDPRKAAKHVRRLVDRGRPALLCTHRPVLPAVLAELAAHAADVVRSALEDGPPLAAGEVLIAHVAHVGGRHTVVDAERLVAPG